MIKAALFDLDGTLIDTENQYTKIWHEIAVTFRPDVERLEYLIKGTTLTSIFATYFPDPKVQEEVFKMLDKGESQMTYEFYPGAIEFINDLKEHGVKCAIVTSSNKLKMQYFQAYNPQAYDLFDFVLTSEDFKASKPNPDCYLRGAEVCGAGIDECAVFEDAFTGLQAGMSSGIFTIGLPTGNPVEAIKDKCHYVLSDWQNFTYQKLCSIVESH